MSNPLHVVASLPAEIDTLVVVGRAQRLIEVDIRRLLPSAIADGPIWDDMVRRGDPGDSGRTATTHTGGSPRRVAAVILPNTLSRHNATSACLPVTGLVRGAASGARVGIVVALDDDAHALAMVLAIARAFPLYSGASKPATQAVSVQVVAHREPHWTALQTAADAVRSACRWVDLPPNQLGPTALVEAAQRVGAQAGATVLTISGTELADQGFGGLWAVGKASVQPPAMVVLDYEPPEPDPDAKHFGWVGKGITYDTGGLSIKPKTSMPGMKTDMAGAAAVLAAFSAATRLGSRHRLTAVLCIAENSVGPHATRPDDIITLYSGKTVEVNNTDAEGRLVLADGLAWLAKHRACTHLIDIATLTGAQLVATGKRHAALYASDDALEREIVDVGRRTGDLCHPLPFAPELFRSELSSPVADMRNSVKDRNNAQSSCAGQFLLNHLDGPFAGAWCHVDMAGPAVNSAGRGTGFGVGLLLALAEVV
jgi:probable aminopeptidase NPEPL1